MSGQKAQDFKEGVEFVLRQPAPSLKPDDQLTLNYDLNLGSLAPGQIGAIRSLVDMMRDDGVDVTLTGYDDEVVLQYMELGRLLQDLRFSYKEKGISGKV